MEDIFNGRSEIRNRVIANIFKELGLIEQWGSGINRIINSCKEYGLPTPKIEEQNDFMDIEIIRSQEELERKRVRKTSEAVGNRREAVGKPSDLGEQEEIILDYIIENGSLKSKKVEEILKIKESRTRELLRGMIDKKLIIRKGQGRATHYTLKQNDN